MKHELSTATIELERRFMSEGKLMSPKKVAEIHILAGVIDKEVTAEIKELGLTGEIASMFHSGKFFPLMDDELIKRGLRV